MTPKVYQEKLLTLETKIVEGKGRLVKLDTEPLILIGCVTKAIPDVVGGTVGRAGEWLTIECKSIALQITPREWMILESGGNPWDRECVLHHHHDLSEEVTRQHSHSAHNTVQGQQDTELERIKKGQHF
jgi:hypothetical protein